MQKYKVFLNEKRILFHAPAKITITKPSTNSIDFTNVTEVKNWLEDFENNTEIERKFETFDPATDFHNFRKSLINLDAAGGVVRKGNAILFIFRSGRWDLPKGKIDAGETAEQAALREVEEECGIKDHRITGTLQPTYHIYRSPYKKNRGEWIFKETRWFDMKYDGVEPGIPETGEGITEIRWFKTEELNEVLANTYENLKVLIRTF